MKIVVSKPAGSAWITPAFVRLPDCARLVWSVKAAVLIRNCRRLPWSLSLVLVTVLKLKPRFTLPRLTLPVVTGETACAVPVRPAVKT